jgi:hypothetical protein
VLFIRLEGDEPARVPQIQLLRNDGAVGGAATGRRTFASQTAAALSNYGVPAGEMT